MQTRLGSLTESVANTAIGYAVAVMSQIAIFPLFGVHLPLTDNLLIGCWFTGISIIRSYCVRRLFNRLAQTKNPTAVASSGRAVSTSMKNTFIRSNSMLSSAALFCAVTRMKSF